MTAKGRAVTHNAAETLTENFSVKLAETFSVNIDDAQLIALVSAGLVGVHRSGSRQRKGGGVYDYRSHYRALRLNCPPRTVLAFGTPDQLKDELAALGIALCFDHSRPQLTVGKRCRQCKGREAAARSAIGN